MDLEVMQKLFPMIINGQLTDPRKEIEGKGNLILKNGHVVDPKNGIDEITDILISDDEIIKVEKGIEKENFYDKIFNCEGLLVVPGLIDMHVHLNDLFEITTDPIYGAVQDGVTMGLSPGAGNTFVAPASFATEMDRGLPMNAGVYIGGATVVSTELEPEELATMFRGEMPLEKGREHISATAGGAMLAPLNVGIKEHMNHTLLSKRHIDYMFEVSDLADIMFMSHTENPARTEMILDVSKGRHFHLGHANVAALGRYGPAEEDFARVLDVAKEENVTGELITSMLRKSLGNRDACITTEKARQMALEALSDGTINVLVSDGQADTSKGGGDTRDNIPAILEIAEEGALSLSDSVATMTANPAALFAKRTKNDWWTEKIGHLGVGALANVTVINEHTKTATATIVNGKVASFESRVFRRNTAAGRLVSKFGAPSRTGFGETSLFQ